MFAFITKHISSATLGFIASTLIACAATFACRAIAPLISHDPAELDGFLFLAGLYWLYSAVGYFAAPAEAAKRSVVKLPRRAGSRGSAGMAGVRPTFG